MQGQAVRLERAGSAAGMPLVTTPNLPGYRIVTVYGLVFSARSHTKWAWPGVTIRVAAVGQQGRDSTREVLPTMGGDDPDGFQPTVQSAQVEAP